MRKNPKALKLVFHGTPAYTIPWTVRWHFASMCSGLEPLKGHGHDSTFTH